MVQKGKKSLRDFVVERLKIFAPLPAGLSQDDLLYLILQRLMTIFSPVLNRTSGKTVQVYVPTSGTAVQLPNLAIPDGFALVVKARKSNVGNIALGFTAGDANHTGKNYYTLVPGEAVSYNVQNANAIYIDAFVGNDGVELTAEQ